MYSPDLWLSHPGYLLTVALLLSCVNCQTDTAPPHSPPSESERPAATAPPVMADNAPSSADDSPSTEDSPTGTQTGPDVEAVAEKSQDHPIQLEFDGLVIRGREYAAHTHGGAPALVDHVTLYLDSEEQFRELSFEGLELLRGHCLDDADDWHGAKGTELSPAEFWLERDDHGEKSQKQITVPPNVGGWQWKITFSPVEVYQACDRFAYRVILAIDEEEVEFEIPLNVIRRQPRPR